MAETEDTTQEASRFLFKGQYIKDVSFENPYAPHSLIPTEEKPAIDISVDFKLQRFEEEHYEIVMHVTARAKAQNNTLFLLELDYGSLVHLINIPADKTEQILLVDCAFVMFPFARRIIADVTRDGGFPPLLLEPIDFFGLYKQKRQQA